MIMHILKATLIPLIFFLLPVCSAISFTMGLIPGAPGAVSSAVSNGDTIYGSAVDERSLRQQIVDSVIAGHAQAEFYRHKKIRPLQITAYSYFGKLYLVGEYDSQEQLALIYECVNKVENKRAVISRLYQKRPKDEEPTEEEMDDPHFISEQAMAIKVKAQLLADFDVTSSPVSVEVLQGDVVLLGVISEQEERDKIVAHALSTAGVNRVVSYLYHNEIAGPEARIMTAELLMPKVDALPVAKKQDRAKVKKLPRPEVTHSVKPVAVMANPDRGR